MNKDKKVVILFVALATFLGASVLMYGLRYASIGDMPENDFGDSLYDKLDRFLIQIKVGNYSGAYKLLSQKSKNSYFGTELALAGYCTRNFLTKNGEIRYISFNKYEQVADNEYLLYVTVGNDEGDILPLEVTREAIETGEAHIYKFSIRLYSESGTYTIEFK